MPDPFTPELIGPSAGHWARRPGEYGKIAFLTSDGGTASPPEIGPQTADCVHEGLSAAEAACPGFA
jgi:hypothetical protein